MSDDSFRRWFKINPNGTIANLNWPMSKPMTTIQKLMHKSAVLDAIQRDSILDSVILKYCTRSEAGHEKYGKTMDRNDLEILEWIDHLQEELMDATLYLEKLKKELEPKLRVYNVNKP